MSNAKGGAFERELMKYLREDLKQDVERLRLSGKEDEGDLLIRESTGDRLVIEAKNVKAMDLAGWVKEAEVEAKNYAEHRGIYQPDFAVVHKRRGKGAADAYVTMPLREYMRQRMAPPF